MAPKIRVRAHNLTANWAWNHFDRVLRGPVKSWFASQEAQFLSPLYPHETDQDRLDTIKKELIETFGAKTLKSQIKQKCAQITFDQKSDPRNYIMQKLEALALINPNMSNKKKIQKIIEGLPSPLNTQLTLVIDPNTTSPIQLLSRLTAYIEISRKHIKPQAEPENNPTIPAVYPTFTQPHTQNLQQSNSLTYSTTTLKSQPIHDPMCLYCGKVGHIAQIC